MRFVCLVVLVSALVTLGGCARQASVPPPPAAPQPPASSSLVCDALLGHFLGLPAEVADGNTDAPVAGRWWVRRCDFGRSGEELFVRLDGRSWFTSGRLLAAPGGVHVLGPFGPDEPLSLDARINSGSGLAWRAVCAPDLERGFAPVEHGEPGQIPAKQISSAGVLSGAGMHNTKLSATDCPFYVIVSPVGREITRAAVRVRHSKVTSHDR